MDIIIKYWAQICLLITITSVSLGYLIKIFLNWRIKRLEIKYQSLHKHKIVEIKEFLTSFLNTKSSIDRYVNQILFGEHDNTIFTEIRTEINACLKGLELNSLILRVLLNEKELQPIEELLKTINDIYKDVNKYLIWSNVKTHNTKKIEEVAERFEQVLDNDIKIKLPTLLSNIISQVKKDYSV